MIYGIRTRHDRQTLVEFKSFKELLLEAERLAAQGRGSTVKRVEGHQARKWVLEGKEHETGLFVTFNDYGIRCARYAPRGS